MVTSTRFFTKPARYKRRLGMRLRRGGSVKLDPPIVINRAARQTLREWAGLHASYQFLGLADAVGYPRVPEEQE